MTAPFLDPHERLVLDLASEVGVVAAASRLEQRELGKRRWIGARNRYREHVLKRLQDDSNPVRATVDAELSEYIAASALLHCADGWGYLGRALSAHAVGDGDTALHLAYYAELRAAVSALGTQGIGVFNDRHVIVTAQGQTHLLRGKRTHQMAWLALRHWASSGGAATVLSSAVAPHGIQLDAWVASLPGGAAWEPLGEEWLKTWGVDLGYFAADRDARNLSSYQPSRIESRRAVAVNDAVSFLKDVWVALQPASPGEPFFILDHHLLRRSLEAAFSSTSNKTPKSDPEGWEAAVDAILASVFGGQPPASLREFLLRSSEPGDLRVVELADVKGDPSKADHHLRVISRATLLLRAASGAVARLLRMAAIQPNVIGFWADALGEDRGFWLPGSPPIPLTDLWLDAKNAIGDLDAAASPAGGFGSYNELVSTCSDALVVLGGCERVALWSAAA